MDLISFDFTPLALALVQVALGVTILILAKMLFGWLSPYSADLELTSRDNPAFGMALAGYYGAVVLIYLAATAVGPLPSDEGLQAALLAAGRDLAWSLAGILALNGSRWILDRLLVAGVRDDLEIVQNRNLAAGVLECGAYVASALILAAAIRQPSGTPLTAAAAYLLGQTGLVITGKLYQRFCGYGLGKEIGKGNFSAGIAFSMTLVALALLMASAVSGEFPGWGPFAGYFALDAGLGLGLLLILRWVTDLALLPNARIAEEIERDRNVNAGLIEGVLAIGIASMILSFI